MTTKTASSSAPPTAAEKAYAAATAATAAAGAALGPANDKLTAAKQALADAQDEALRAITEKSADAAAAKERFVRARQAVKDREDELDDALFELQAVEVGDQQAHDAEQVARRRVIIEEVVKADAEFNDPESRENVLLGQITDGIAELIPLINDRKDRQERLASEWAHIPVEERPQIKGGPRVSISTRWVTDHVANLTTEVLAAIRAGTEEAEERRRTQRAG